MENYDAVIRELIPIATPEFTGVEVGVRSGIFSARLLEKFKTLHMLCIDPYLPYHDVGTDITQAMQEGFYRQAKAMLEPFGMRAMLKRQTSLEAVDYVEEAEWFYDFVFIDAEHTYAAVKADIAAWAPRIWEGGLLMGHDYDMDPVKQAVNEFATKHSAPVKHYLYPADVWVIEVTSDMLGAV